MRRLYLATFSVSGAAIGYELLLMRVLSIVQWHHFAYMIISLALLGYGASGTFIALFRRHLESRFDAAFATCALLFSVTMVLCYVLGQRVPFNALEVVWEPSQLLNLSLIYLVFFVPFFFAACCIGLAFTCRSEQISRIYFADLLGAGLGAAAIIGLMFLLPPHNALLVLMMLPLIASVSIGLRSSARTPLIATQLVWLVLLFSGIPQQYFGLRISEYKGLYAAMQVVDSRVLGEWSSPISHVTVVDSPTVPIRHAPGLSFATRHIPPQQLAVFSDGDGMSAITRFDGDMSSLGYLGDTTGALPYALLDEPDVLILGAGGGEDVLRALYHGARNIDAVELDPTMVSLVGDRYADYAGRIYSEPRVRVHTREARGFVARSEIPYDLIQIGLLDSFGAAGSGVQSLNESYVYTVEALREYVEHTTDGGIVAITRWIKLPPRDSLKLIATAIAALRDMGVEDPGRQLAVIRGWNTSTVLIRNGHFDDNDIGTIQEFARSRSFDTAWFPGIAAGDANRFNRLDQAYLYEGTAALLGDDAAQFAGKYKFYIGPATDDRPYFFHFFRWDTLPEIFALRHAGGAGLIEWGYLILIATLVQAVIAGFVLILLPLAFVKRDWPASVAPRMGGYFLLLGFAFLFVEMAFIQKFILFLNHPLYAVAVVLAGFLVFAGIGSAWSKPLTERMRRRGRAPILLPVGGIGLLVLLYIVSLPWLFALLMGFPDPAKIALSIALIAPLGIAMGMPFPIGLSQLADTAPGFIPWAWGINGFASVMSAALATVLAVEFGFTAVVLLALLLYAAAAAMLIRPNSLSS